MYGGITDTIGSILDTFGISIATTQATARAFASPSIASINAVKEAFAAEGAGVPAELLDALYGRYYDSIATNKYGSSGQILASAGEWLPWLIGGAALLFIVMKQRR